MRVQSQVPLAPKTSLQLGGSAQYFVRVEHEHILVAALNWAKERGLPVGLLGGGSNLIVADGGFQGLVIEMALRGVAARPEGSEVEVSAQAGEVWDDLVAYTVAQQWAGLECLSGIPGRVGASPVQNIGAYGQEVAQCIQAVRVYDRREQRFVERSPEACAFAYRDSAFKRDPHRDVIVAVRFRLRPGGAVSLRYGQLAARVGPQASLADVRATVLQLRREKSMVFDPDDENRRSAGSFFTNPVVSAAQAGQIAARAHALGVVEAPEEMPQWPSPQGVKLAAAWLIEAAGFYKGQVWGGVGISSRHALCLINRGGGTSAELMALAGEIQARVHALFGVQLVPEPVRWGFE